MKIQWEVTDIVAGRRSKKPGTMGYGHIIGYDTGAFAGSSTWALISLDDGLLVRRDVTRDAIAEVLNSIGDVPIELFGPYLPDRECT